MGEWRLGGKMLNFYIKFEDYVNLLLNVCKQIKEAEAKAALEEEKRRQQVTKQNVQFYVSLHHCKDVSMQTQDMWKHTN